MRVTEQGEIINEKYGLRGIALRTLEQLLASVSIATANPERNTPEPSEWREMMDTLAAESRSVYRGLVYERPGFFDYFRCATPIDVIERMRIGSRPSSRRKQRGIQDLRAIPWVFAWTQSRHILPGWFGFGSGLRAAIEIHGEEAFAAMTRDWFYLQSLLGDVEMVLAKSDMTIAARYSALAGTLHEKFFPTIQEEFELTREMVLKLNGNRNLLDHDKTMQRAIMLRNPYVDPMSLLQVDLLARWRAKEREDDELFAALLASVNGIAQGLQSTG
jgi:phosphoenolpyruvate carboxylase